MDLARPSGVGDGNDDRDVTGQHGNGMLGRYPKELLPSHLHESQ